MKRIDRFSTSYLFTIKDKFIQELLILKAT